jgi:hypothetical protein
VNVEKDEFFQIKKEKKRNLFGKQLSLQNYFLVESQRENIFLSYKNNNILLSFSKITQINHYVF